jgi:hypothetical protein
MIALRTMRLLAASFILALGLAMVPQAVPADTIGDTLVPGTTTIDAHKHCWWTWRHHHHVRVCRWY